MKTQSSTLSRPLRPLASHGQDLISRSDATRPGAEEERHGDADQPRSRTERDAVSEDLQETVEITEDEMRRLGWLPPASQP